MLQKFEKAKAFTKGKSLPKNTEVYTNNKYLVTVRQMGGWTLPSEDSTGIPVVGPKSWHLSIRRHDKKAIRDYRDLQHIKDMICGPETTGFEVFPAQSQLVDTSNHSHLWVFDGLSLPFSFREGKITLNPEHVAVGP